MLKYLIALMPSRLKIIFYRLLGARIGNNCYIGFSIIDAENLEIGENVYIGHLNLLWRLKELKFEPGSRLTMFNWITGGRQGSFLLGRNSAITRLHFIEASSDIRIGSNSIIAGRSSHFLTHGISATNLDDQRPITIGNWCYIGSSSRFVPGSGVSDYTFVGMGSVVTKNFQDKYVLIAGSPSVVKKILSPDAVYFNRDHLSHSHHPKTYKG